MYSLKVFPPPSKPLGLVRPWDRGVVSLSLPEGFLKPSGQGQEPETQRLKTGRFNDDLSSLTLNLPSNSIYSRTVG